MRVKTKTKFKREDRKKDNLFMVRKKVCRFCMDKASTKVDYKDMRRLESFIKERGKILSRRVSGNCAKHQRVIAEAIKKARFIALLPYVRN